MRKKPRDHEVLIMNFTGIYSLEKFAGDRRFTILDCRNIRGVDKYCDNESLERLKDIIAPYPYKGIHFLDSGNYHYLTKLWTDKIHEPFGLVVFDHHTDMQEPAFGPILSCGDWVKEALSGNPFLKKVMIAGPPATARETLAPELYGKVEFCPEEKVTDKEFWKDRLDKNDIPLYISIDKDIFRKSQVPTNWDQGGLSVRTFDEILSVLIRHENVIGVDICGECSPSLDYITRLHAAEKDNRANECILETILGSSD